MNACLQLLKSSDLWNFERKHGAPQLLVYELHALQRRLLQTRNLLLDEHLERLLRHEEARTQATSVSNGGLNVLLAKLVEGVDS